MPALMVLRHKYVTFRALDTQLKFGGEAVLSMFGGFRLMNEIADWIGVERSVFKAALTEVGVNYAFVKFEFRAALAASGHRNECIEEFAAGLVDPAYSGLQIMEQKFPEEDSIRQCQRTLISYARRKGLLDEEDAPTEVEVLPSLADVGANALAFLRLQNILFARDDGGVPKKAKDNWSLGYVSGVVDQMLELNQMHREGADPLVLKRDIHQSLLGEYGAFNRLIRTGELQEQGNEAFQVGEEAAREDICNWTPDQPPTSWLRYVKA